MPRAFAAIALPPEQREVMSGYLARCAVLAPSFRWVDPAGLHVTLRFMGALEEPVLSSVRTGLAQIGAEPFEAAAGGLGSFGGPRRASVAWLELERGREGAAALAAACERACRAAGLVPEDRDYRPHITLARARRRGGEPLPDLPPPPRLPPWRVEEFVLYESRLGGGLPPVYVPMATFKLGD